VHFTLRAASKALFPTTSPAPRRVFRDAGAGVSHPEQAAAPMDRRPAMAAGPHRFVHQPQGTGRRPAQYGLPIRVLGAALVTPLAVTDSTRFSFDGLSRSRGVDPGRQRSPCGPHPAFGTLARDSRSNGLAIESQGDIDAQALAGAFEHGDSRPGARLGCIASRHWG